MRDYTSFPKQIGSSERQCRFAKLLPSRLVAMSFAPEAFWPYSMARLIPRSVFSNNHYNLPALAMTISWKLPLCSIWA